MKQMCWTALSAFVFMNKEVFQIQMTVWSTAFKAKNEFKYTILVTVYLHCPVLNYCQLIEQKQQSRDYQDK